MRHRFSRSISTLSPRLSWTCAILVSAIAAFAHANDIVRKEADSGKPGSAQGEAIAAKLVRPVPIRLASGNEFGLGGSVAAIQLRHAPIKAAPFESGAKGLNYDASHVVVAANRKYPRDNLAVRHALNISKLNENAGLSINCVEHRQDPPASSRSTITEATPLELKPAPRARASSQIDVSSAHAAIRTRRVDDDKTGGLTIHFSDQATGAGSIPSNTQPSRKALDAPVRQVQVSELQNQTIQDAQGFDIQSSGKQFQKEQFQSAPSFTHEPPKLTPPPIARRETNPSVVNSARPSEEVVVPVPQTPVTDDITMNRVDGLVTLIASGADLQGVLRLIADHHKLNLVLGPDVAGPVTVSIRGARLDEVLDAILGVAGFSWHQVGNLLYVTGSTNASMNPRVQGRTVQVYQLNYVAAQEVEAVANRLLSPVGNVFISESALDDQRRTREVLIVEDTQEAHYRIAQYISQIDVAPKQVLVEAHVLQVALHDDNRHGINLRSLARLDGSRISLEGSGFAETNVGGPSLALRIDGTDMDGLIELIRENTNSRTLASPKLSVVNRQEARIQIGQRLPYAVATTTQTSTIQSVEFLDVGIVLTVQPIITDDGNVLMTVLPKVSGGRITESGFPEEDTTELSTTILMPDGGGIVIGGLIREEDSNIQAHVPGFSRVPVVGQLFQRRNMENRRNELIIALVTHVLPDVYSVRSHEMCELERTLPAHAKYDLLHPGLTSQNYQGSRVLHTSKKPTKQPAQSRTRKTIRR